jgi:hypothetical protein
VRYIWLREQFIRDQMKAATAQLIANGDDDNYNRDSTMSLGFSPLLKGNNGGGDGGGVCGKSVGFSTFSPPMPSSPIIVGSPNGSNDRGIGNNTPPGTPRTPTRAHLVKQFSKLCDAT